jgi:hypothetical protein
VEGGHPNPGHRGSWQEVSFPCLTWGRGRAIETGMENPIDKEDILIRRILIGASAAAVLGILTLVTVVAVMVSYNFNILEWME